MIIGHQGNATQTHGDMVFHIVLDTIKIKSNKYQRNHGGIRILIPLLIKMCNIVYFGKEKILLCVDTQNPHCGSGC